MNVNKMISGIVCVLVIFACISVANAGPEDIIYEYGFEQGLADWHTDNGVWDLCVRSEPDPNMGYFFVETICGGNYPVGTNSRLISGSIDLPSISGDEEIHLRFWHWFSYDNSYHYPSNYNDYGYIQINVYNEISEQWSGWSNIGNTIYNTSSVWTLMDVDLTKYAGKKIQIGFYHQSDGGYVSTGWQIDNIKIIKKEPEFTGDFENGWDDWSADRGVWEIGEPTAGPGNCYSGTQCAGTVLNGNYPGNTDSRLVSPSINLPSVSGIEEIHLRFQHWFSYDNSYHYPDNYNDYGYVQIRTFDEASEEWSAWSTIGNTVLNYSALWSLMDIDLTQYSGKKVKISFYHTSDGGYTSSGWYIDDVEIVNKLPELSLDFECGWDDWSADRGVWEIGMPTAGPANSYSGQQCAGTVLSGNYPDNTDSRLISPTFSMPDIVSNQEIHIRFRHWFSYDNSYHYPNNYNDYGYFQIKVFDEASEEWSSWTDLLQISQSSGTWTLVDLDLTSYANKQVKFAFYHTADGGYTSTGWYVDHIRIYVDSENYFPHMCECDLNLDGRCDMLDWLLFGQDWGATDCNDPGVNCECDYNRDGKCDMLDWLRFGDDWSRTDCLLCENPAL
jgi:bacillopeptidase F (M6 metalloprotease family)